MEDIVPGGIPVAFGDLSKFIVNTVRGSYRIFRYDETYVAKLQVGFQAFARVAAGVAAVPGAPSPINYLINRSVSS